MRGRRSRGVTTTTPRARRRGSAARHLGDAEAQKRLAKRWAIIQVWRPIRGRVLADPLGICDGRTIPHEGFILLQRRYRTAPARSITSPTTRITSGSISRRWSATRRWCSRCSTPTKRADAVHRAHRVRRSQHAAGRAARARASRRGPLRSGREVGRGLSAGA